MTYREGAENVPIKDINKHMPILVLIYNLKNDDLVEEKRIDYGKADDRRWLGRMTFWAITNHCSVETMALSDVDLEVKKG